MDALQTAITGLALVAIFVLIVVSLCRRLAPKVPFWVCSRSSHEEKIGLSKNKLFNANGYLIHSGSDILLSSTGSFKRFESIDRDYRDLKQSALTSPTWVIPAKAPQTDNIPPQPLRPAPAPATIFVSRERQIKQQSFDNLRTVSSSRLSITGSSSFVIPRPVARRQMSSPAGTINLSIAVAEISSGPKSFTNPFIKGSDSFRESDLETTYCSTFSQQLPAILTEEQEITQPIKNNPFIPNWIELMPSDLKDHASKPKLVTNAFFCDAPQSTVFVETPDTIISSSSIGSWIKTNTFRSRSRSEAEIEIDESVSVHYLKSRKMSDSHTRQTYITNTTATTTNPFKCGSLHKTLSENYLEQMSNHVRNYRSSSQQWQFGKALTRQCSNISLTKSILINGGSGSASGSQSSIVSEGIVPAMTRAVSCDSLSSESSVLLADLETPLPQVTGLLCVGLQYDKNSQTSEGVQLYVTVLEAKELIRPLIQNEHTPLDTFVRMYLVPDETEALQTKLFKNSACPSYNETFSFWLCRKRSRRSLWFHLYDSGACNTLLGEAEMHLTEIMRPTTTWLSLSDSNHKNSQWGDLMFSICYLPTAERLTVVVVKARNLKTVKDSQALQNIFVKVYLLKNNQKVSKKKTSVKRFDNSPIYNESMIFNVPPNAMNGIQIRLSVYHIAEAKLPSSAIGVAVPIGHIIVGGSSNGKALRHWNQMLISLRKPIAMWHPIRRSSKDATTREAY